MNELKDCPFCGSRNVSLTEWFGEYFAGCNDCKAKTVTTRKDYAKIAWNQRTEKKATRTVYVGREECTYRGAVPPEPC